MVILILLSFLLSANVFSDLPDLLLHTEYWTNTGYRKPLYDFQEGILLIKLDYCVHLSDTHGSGFVFLYARDKNKCLFQRCFSPYNRDQRAESLKMTMNPRYLIYLPPHLFYSVAMFISLIFRLIPNRNLAVFFRAILIGIMNAHFSRYYSSYTKRLAGFAGTVQTKTQDGDIIVVYPVIWQCLSMIITPSHRQNVGIWCRQQHRTYKNTPAKGNKSVSLL